MLYWICPECGHECSPAIRECPTCTTAEIVSLARSFQTAPPEAARPAVWEAAKSVIAPLPVVIAKPALVAAKAPQPELGLKLAGLAPAGDIAFQAAASGPQPAREQAAEPAPSSRQSVAFVRQASPGVLNGGLPLADLADPGELRPPPLPRSDETSATPLDPKPGRLAFITSKLQLAGASLLELERAAIEAIRASFQIQPATSLLCEACEIVAAPAPPSDQWMRSPRIVLVPQAPAIASAMLTAAPQPPTLAGPCLPAQLQRFTESQKSRQRPARRRASAPTWLLSLMVAVALFLGAATLFQFMTDNRNANAASVTPAPARVHVPIAAAPAPVGEEHPAARFVEVAGVRVVATANHKPQLQYIVINHSAGELTGLSIHIALHSVDSPGTPLIRVSSVVPSLGPNQSKEIRTDLDSSLSAASIPDWQSLRADVLVARQ